MKGYPRRGVQRAISVLGQVLLLGTSAGCAFSRLGEGHTNIELGWKVCPVTRGANGGEVDDGGVDVAATIDGGRRRTFVVGHFPGGCDREPGALPKLHCGDPHVDVDFVVQWTRPSASSMVLERVDYPRDDDDEQTPSKPLPPPVRRVITSVDVAPTARVVEVGPTGCSRS